MPIVFLKSDALLVPILVEAGDIIDPEAPADMGLPTLGILMKHSKEELGAISNHALGASGFTQTSKEGIAQEVLKRWNRLSSWASRGGTSEETSSVVVKGPSRSDLIKQALDVGLKKINIYKEGEPVKLKSGQNKLVDVSNREVNNSDLAIAITNHKRALAATDICLKLM